jgi:Transposase family tnp2
MLGLTYQLMDLCRITHLLLHIHSGLYLFFLTLFLLGPKHPGRDIDICLEPLIDELQSIWSIGKQTYDVSIKQNFPMRAVIV